MSANQPTVFDHLPPSALSERQQARAECLRIARAVSVARSTFNAAAVDALDLVSIARYIETGNDPWGPPGDAE